MRLDMKTVILAAGVGSRLKSLTNDRPKTMLEIMKNTLIHYIISALLKNGIADITMVVGFQYEKLIKYLKENFPEVKFKFIVNPEYQNKENIYSLYLALPYIRGEDIMILNSDIFCEDKIIKKAIEATFNTMIVDADTEYTVEATKVKIDASGYISDIGKNLTFDESDGEYIGILKLLKNSTDLYFDQITQMVQNGDVHVWYPYAFRKILPLIRIEPIFTDKLLWEEIDTAPDYERAIQKAKEIETFSNNQLNNHGINL